MLFLEVETEEGKFSFELLPEQSVLIGRKADADVRLNRSSVSQTHLRITWTGREIVVKDLNSSYGTFRLPQEAAFSEASFPPVYAPLELRLAKSRVVITWRRKDFVAEPTEVVPGTSAALLPELQRSAESSLPEKPPAAAKTVTATNSKPRPETPRASPVTKSISPAARDSASATALVCLGAVVLSGLIIFIGAVACKGILRSPAMTLRAGGIFDLLALWTHFLNASKEIFFVLTVIAFWLARRWLTKVAQGRSSLANRLGPAFRWASAGWVATMRLLSLVSLALALGWPYLLALRYGQPPRLWFRSLTLYEQATAKPDPSMSLEALQARSRDIKALAREFPGSSLLYGALLQNQRQRVLKECGGVGEAPWDNKKVCLVLLFAVSVETREETLPALLQDISARVSILLSLDGITRVLAAEGTASPMIPFFLESLDLVGLSREKADISGILGAAKTPETEKATIETLKDLRRRIEIRLQERQRELAYPAVLRLNVPGPLESGI